MDEDGNVFINKSKLLAKGYNKQEGIKFNETYAHAARLEGIRMLLAFSVHHEFQTFFQTDVKSSFLNEYTQEEVFVDQPLDFINLAFLNHVFKLKKILYGLKQAPRSWYGRLSKFLLENNFQRGQVYKIIFIKKSSMTFYWFRFMLMISSLVLVKKSLCKYFFFEMMHNKCKMSMMG